MVSVGWNGQKYYQPFCTTGSAEGGGFGMLGCMYTVSVAVQNVVPSSDVNAGLLCWFLMFVCDGVWHMAFGNCLVLQ